MRRPYYHMSIASSGKTKSKNNSLEERVICITMQITYLHDNFNTLDKIGKKRVSSPDSLAVQPVGESPFGMGDF